MYHNNDMELTTDKLLVDEDGYRMLANKYRNEFIREAFRNLRCKLKNAGIKLNGLTIVSSKS